MAASILLMGPHVALLRGINVGGNHIVKMADLRACFEAMGFTGVATHIQSGNVVFVPRRASKARLTATIEDALCERFGHESRVVLLSAEELERVVAQAPRGFGKQPARFRYDVLFVREPMTTREALEQVTTKPGVDAADAGDHALYFRRLVARAAKSHLPKLIQRPVYKSLTVRNWNTTTRLLSMVRGRP